MLVVYKKRKQCENKRKHPDKASADRSVNILNNAGNNFYSYECPYCQRWHVGHIIRQEAAPLDDSPGKYE